MTMHSRLKLGGSLKVALIKKGLRHDHAQPLETWWEFESSPD